MKNIAERASILFDAAIYWLFRRPSMKVRYVGEMRRVQMQPGDVLVLSTEGPVSDETARRLCEDIQARFKGHKCIVLCDGLRLGVVGVPTLTDEVPAQGELVTDEVVSNEQAEAVK